MVDWITNSDLVEYADAVREMETRVDRIAAGTSSEAVWLLEHPPLYTAGKSAKSTDLNSNPRFPVLETSRGGQYTYHGPGQRVAYIMLDLRRRDRDVKKFVRMIQNWAIIALSDFGVQGHSSSNGIGVWVERRTSMDRGGPKSERKIAAIGLRLRRWISFHGISINVAPNLDHYADIVPCGIREFGVSSLADLGVETTMQEVDRALIRNFDAAFHCGNEAFLSNNGRTARLERGVKHPADS